MMNENIPLKIEKLTKDYGSLRAVDSVSLIIKPKEIYGLLGPNGAGKTSIISVVTTLEEATSGSVKVFGSDVSVDPKLAKSHIGCVPQELVNHGFFTVNELLHIYSGYHGIAKNDERIAFLLDRLSLWEQRNKRVKELSGGMKRRLMIAKALVHNPKFLLLDEPTAGVDVELRSKLWDFVLELREEGVSVLLTTHYLEEAEALCDRVAFIDCGKILLEGAPKDLVKEFTEREVILTLKSPVEKLHHRQLISQTDHQLTFKFTSTKSVGELISELPLEITEIQDLYIREGKLEDAFQRVVHKS